MLLAVVTVVVPAGPVRANGPTWVSPVPGLEIVKAYEQPEHEYAAGHRGIDVEALPGEPVRAPAFGTVTYAGFVAGRGVVSIRVGARIVSYEPVVPAVEIGDLVWPAIPIGVVGAGTHCVGCLHVGVRSAVTVGRVYENPAPLFAVETSILLPDDRAPSENRSATSGNSDGVQGSGAWGGHENGRIPQDALCRLASAPGHYLRCDAARAFESLDAAFRERFGYSISVTDAYRDYATQVILKQRKGRFAATPGTSNHGWGLALDLGSGINRFGTAQHEWMRTHAGSFGWVHPSWAGQGGSLPEAWHWEFVG
ncbi:D-alanyl-D-alanine carboxypeptidase family protein [Brevibacterium litoralis]|uniref:D-alanyl-D-alanine carboxypeptidase family protein n=1 Tax=Brevibacterium litoralis TaxID=3138935 RepID=UPI0032EE3E6F